MNTNNSLSTIIKQFLEINTNTLNAFERINEAVISDRETVPLDILTEDGDTKTIYVPAFGYMNRELKRLDQNIKALSGLTDGTAKVRLADGSYQKILKSSLKTPAADITNVNRPFNFNIKSNNFFEDFLTPLLTTSFDVSDQIPTDTERVLVKRVVIDGSFDFAAQFFDDNYKGVDDISYNDLINAIAFDNIPFYVDEEVRDMPYRNTLFYGKFDVTSVDTIQKTIIVEGEETRKTIKLYTLDKLTYSDSNKDLKDTEFLKVGDEIIVNSARRGTKYKVKTIYSETRQVELDIVEGYEAIKIGADVLSIYKANDTQVNIEINVGFNERFVVFFKPIDPNSKIIAENWSPGAAVYSNELTMTMDSGETTTLANYYKQNVADFGQFIKALKEDPIPPSTLGVAPNIPDILEENFKVVQINKHLTENDAALKVKKLNADKVSADSTIKKLDDSISKKRALVATKKYKSKIERDRDKNELTSLINERSSESKLYSSIVSQIQSAASDAQLTKIEPKYRIRGFWAIPEPKLVAETIPQEVVKFKVQYRYLSTTGKTSEIAQISFDENGNKRTGVFSNWNEYETPVRARLRDEEGKFYWSNSAVEDGQEVNFNQLDIPIQPGEVVEFKIKSISEAGWPSNPLESDWSDIIRVSFPEGELDNVSVTNLVEENANEVARVKLLEELEAAGVYSHITDAFSANEKYFAHTANTIASGFLSPEQNPVSLFDKLSEMQSKLTALEEVIANIRGELTVTLIAEDGTTTEIKNNTNNKVFAGYYVDEVADLAIKKGHIVTKKFKLVLGNAKSTTLELIARTIGDRSLPVYKSTDSTVDNGFGYNPAGTIDAKVIDDNYYRTEAKYDMVPIQYQTLGEETETEYTKESPYQSIQRRGQFIYSRYMDVANESPLYIKDSAIADETLDLFSDYEYELGYSSFSTGTNADASPLPTSGDASSNNFIWSGTFGVNRWIEATEQGGVTTPGTTALFNVDNIASDPNASNTHIDVSGLPVDPNRYDNGIFLHKSHPDLANIFEGYINVINPDLSALPNNVEIQSDDMTLAVEALVNNMIYSMPKTATLLSTDANGLKQLAFRNDDTVNRSIKMSFDANDQFLLGGKSCGSFLFMSPINTESLMVDGDNKFGKARVFEGDNNSISIDIVFQYRMTDYAGNNPNSDTGRIGGILSRNVTNLTYSKKIGLDIFDSSDNQFSFDIEVFAKYKAQGSNQNSVKAATLSA
jgi:hypothetical protein